MVQLGGILKTGEAAVARVEELAHVVERRAVRQQHLGAHRAEAVHDPALWTWGATVCGAGLTTALPPKLVVELAVLVEAAALEVTFVVAVECVAGCASRTASPKAAKALTATALIE